MAKRDPSNVVSMIKTLITEDVPQERCSDPLLLSPALRVEDRFDQLDDLSAAELIEDLVSQIKGSFEDEVDDAQVLDTDDQPDLPFDRSARPAVVTLARVLADREGGDRTAPAPEPAQPSASAQTTSETPENPMREMIREELRDILAPLIQEEVARLIKERG